MGDDRPAVGMARLSTSTRGVNYEKRRHLTFNFNYWARSTQASEYLTDRQNIKLGDPGVGDFTNNLADQQVNISPDNQKDLNVLRKNCSSSYRPNIRQVNESSYIYD